MKFDFLNDEGEKLSGRLELPSAKIQAYAIFAHCFTCSKDIIAASIISKNLTEKGIAVLRFDFTGLGNSEGDFSNTNFSSNVRDLLSAYKAMSDQYETPQLLIGHSLGGAAVLKVAPQIETLKAVVTIGAPSDTQHVKHLFQDDEEKILSEGKADVLLAGRQFTIKKQFIDDIRQTDVLNGLKTMKKALLVMHSPLDNTVSIDHAAEIFLSAKHPKSFVSLDKADHLLMSRKDAEYAAQVIGSWAQNYLELSSDLRPPLNANEVFVKNREDSKFTHDVYSQHHHTIADEPKSMKGNDLGMNPYEYLLSALGACTAMTMRVYADHKGFDLKTAEVKLYHEKIHAKDCEDCKTEKGKIDSIRKEIFIKGNLTPEQKQKIYDIAEKCPVNRTLQSEVKISSIHRE